MREEVRSSTDCPRAGCLCVTESVSYEFGAGGGQIEYQYERNRRPDRRNDLIAVGFSTTKPDGTLLRIDSDTHPDYLEIKLVSAVSGGHPCATLPDRTVTRYWCCRRTARSERWDCVQSCSCCHVRDVHTYI